MRGPVFPPAPWLQLMFGDTPLVMVEDDASLAALCEHLATQDVIGVDTESDSFHHYQEKVCLIQLSDMDKDYIIDPLKVPELAPLKAVLDDEAVVKVLHGADYDVVCLKRDFDISIHGMFDTMIAAQFLGMDKIGLADLIGHFFGVRLEKKYQRHDWSRRPLLDEHLHYARGDTHWLIALREILVHKLDREGWLDAAAEECAALEQREWSGRTAHPSDFLRVKKASTLDDVGKKVLRALWEYRDGKARDYDRPAFKVIPGQSLIAIARQRPTTLDALGDVVRPKSSLFHKHGEALVAAVNAGLADDRALPTPPKKTPKKRRASRPSNDQLLGALRSWRNSLVEREGVSPVVVANNQLLKEIATAAPLDREALAQVEGIRNWQVEIYGDDLLDLVQADQKRQEGKPKKRRRRRRRRADS